MNKNTSPSAAMWIFGGLYVACSMGLLSVLFVPVGASADGGTSGTFLAAWAIMDALVLMVILRKGLELRHSDLPVIALCVLIGFSIFWSDNPVRTAQYGLAFGMNVLFAFVLRKHFSLDQFLSLLLRVILLLSVVGLILSFVGFQPSRYIDVHDRFTLLGTEPIRGLSNHKITAGLYAAIGLVITAHKLSGLARMFAMAVLTLFILLTGSSASLALAVIGLGLLVLLDVACRRRLTAPTLWSLLAYLAFLAAIILVTDFEGILGLLGRDATLTGRTELWAWGIDVGFQKPIFGWGFLGYIGSDAAAAVARSIPGFQTYDVPHFHDSYIQMFVELGAIGLFICLWIIFRAAHNFYSIATKKQSKTDLLACTLVLLLAISALFIHTFFKYNDFPSLAFIYLSLVSVSTQPKFNFVSSHLLPHKVNAR